MPRRADLDSRKDQEILNTADPGGSPLPIRQVQHALKFILSAMGATGPDGPVQGAVNVDPCPLVGPETNSPSLELRCRGFVDPHHIVVDLVEAVGYRARNFKLDLSGVVTMGRGSRVANATVLD